MGNRASNCFHTLSRREFMAISSTLAGATWLSGCQVSKSNRPDPVLKIGYLPITDATPLLIGHAKKFFEAEGLVVDKPVLIRGWSELAEAFLAGNFNLVHLLLPVP